jgi:hypothetical protein
MEPRTLTKLRATTPGAPRFARSYVLGKPGIFGENLHLSLVWKKLKALNYLSFRRFPALG